MTLTDYTAALQATDDPLREALAMTQAIQQLFVTIRQHDPSERDAALDVMLSVAESSARTLAEVLNDLIVSE